jgi:Fur family ferric uptake transcriptional regulator
MMQKDLIIQKLREQGCRITKQRLMILDIILQEDCSCCKEIYYKASKLDSRIGSATVYRMINTLEEIGAISRKIRFPVPWTVLLTAVTHVRLNWRTAQSFSFPSRR